MQLFIIGPILDYNQKLGDTVNEALKQALSDAKQTHLTAFYDKLNTSCQSQLDQDLAAVDFAEIKTLIATLESLKNPDFGKITPPKPAFRRSDDDAARNTGEDALRAGRVGVFLVAGGQGTRLGFPGPKGTFPISPVNDKTLFQLQAEQIVGLNNKYNTNIPWYIMTSDNNHDDTQSFLTQNNHFGLDAKDVICFKQAWMPAIDMDGKIILDEKHSLFKSPNGHGGSIKALHDSGALADMKLRGIDTLFYYQVDNVLIQIADPTLLGFHLQENADMSAKVLSKRNPEEKVGVYCEIDGKPSVVEYSDLSEEDMYAKNKDGELQYNAGNIAIHVFDRVFLESLNANGCQLPFHLAEKKIPFINAQGEKISPEKNNGTKFEMFVFDTVTLAKNPTLYEGKREVDFAPVKNAEGEDSPASARQALCNLWGNWAAAAGYEVARNDGGDVSINIEISPLFAISKNDFVEKTKNQEKAKLADNAVFE